MNLSQEFERALALARITMRFGQVRRVTLHEDGEPESDTTHTVMLTLVGIEMAPLVGCDPGLVAQFAAVHDLPETYAGDTNTARGLSPAQVEEKASREARAIERLHEEIGGSPVLALLRRYEAQQEPEARLVRYLDKVMPKLTHFLNRGLALAALGLTTSDVREKHATQGAQLATQYPELASVRRLFEEACSAVEANVMDHPLVATGEEHRDNNECSACGATFSWNEGTDRDEPNQICNPCAQQIASAARTSEVIADALDALREQATKLSLSASMRGPDAGLSPSRHQGPAALLFFTAEYLRGHVARLARLKVEHEEANNKIAERLRNVMSTCFDGSRSGDLAFQLEDMEEWIPKFTSEWKANHRRWLALCDRLGFDALDLGQRGRVAGVDAIAGHAFELRRIRAIVEDDARKRHGDREGEPSWGVIADCVLGHASQHRQAREILGVPEQFTLDQYASILETARAATREQLAGAMNLIASLRADLTRVEPSAARAEIQDVLASLSAMKEPPPAGLTLTEAVSWLVQRRDEYKVLFEEGVDETRACRAHLTARHAEIDETREALAPIVKGPVRSVKALSMGALAREVVAQAERWRIDAEHYRGEASNATAKQVESLSAEVARLTGEVAATQAEAKRQIDDAWRHMDRDLIEADEALRAQVGKSIGPVPLPRQLPLLLWFIAGYLESAARDTKRSTEATPLTPAAAPKVRCTGNVTVRINKDRVIVKGQTWTSDDPNFKAWDVSLHDDDPRFGFGEPRGPEQRSRVGPTMELGARTGTWTWKGSMGGFGDIKWQGAWTAESKQATDVERLDYSRFPPGYSGETTTEDAWAEWKSKNDPPGFTVYHNGPTWLWQLDAADGAVGEAFEGTAAGAEDARCDAWKWYDRRLAIVSALDAMSKGGYSRANWPRCLTWSRVQVDEVERWLTDPEPFALLPVVLRG